MSTIDPYTHFKDRHPVSLSKSSNLELMQEYFGNTEMIE